jgi:bacillopeptidase F (M6 metalloprotease family)
VQADLAAYAGQVVTLRFAFRTDTSITYPGVYIDDLIVAGN